MMDRAHIMSGISESCLILGPGRHFQYVTESRRVGRGTPFNRSITVFRTPASACFTPTRLLKPLLSQLLKKRNKIIYFRKASSARLIDRIYKITPRGPGQGQEAISLSLIGVGSKPTPVPTTSGMCYQNNIVKAKSSSFVLSIALICSSVQLGRPRRNLTIASRIDDSVVVLVDFDGAAQAVSG